MSSATQTELVTATETATLGYFATFSALPGSAGRMARATRQQLLTNPSAHAQMVGLETSASVMIRRRAQAMESASYKIVETPSASVMRVIQELHVKFRARQRNAVVTESVTPRTESASAMQVGSVPRRDASTNVTMSQTADPLLEAAKTTELASAPAAITRSMRACPAVSTTTLAGYLEREGSAQTRLAGVAELTEAAIARMVS